METVDFTWEFWVYPTSSLEYQAFLDSRQNPLEGGDTTGYYFGTNVNTLTPIVYTNGIVLQSTGDITLNEWNHVALTRSSGTIDIWINGVNRGSNTDSTNLTNQRIFIGGDAISNGLNLTGNLSNIRITKGVAIYTTNFTIPTTNFTVTQTANVNGNPSAEITAGQTQLLLNTNFSTGFLTDTSTNNFTVVNNGGVTSSNYEPFTPVPGPTPTPTTTSTPTETPTNTPTPTQTTTQTPTPTETNTPTPTVTETNTQTPTPTETNTPTPTVTETNTPTPTPTVTETNTPTPTVTQTNTPTPSATSGQTPTLNMVIAGVYSNVYELGIDLSINGGSTPDSAVLYFEWCTDSNAVGNATFNINASVTGSLQIPNINLSSTNTDTQFTVWGSYTYNVTTLSTSQLNALYLKTSTITYTTSDTTTRVVIDFVGVDNSCSNQQSYVDYCVIKCGV
jgi:outer membrane biosynthesis protein TonB